MKTCNTGHELIVFDGECPLCIAESYIASLKQEIERLKVKKETKSEKEGVLCEIDF